jgi:hypothetical protein
MATTMAQVARDYVTDGVPSSGSHKIKKSDMRTWGAWVEGIISAFTANGGLIYSSKAAIDADLAHAANSMAWVLGDATAANNGVYGKVGASGTGSWTRRADLPFSFIIASDAGAGTANAIQATTSLPVSESALIWMNIFEANTASPVTVSFNGGSALTIKTNSNNNVAAGGLTSGMIVAGIVSGSTFRLLSDQVSTAIVAAAEAAQAAAEAAQVAAEDAQVAAEAAAASINLPAIAANRMIVDNAAGTARESKTFAEVATLLDVQQRNADGGLSFSLTATPSTALGSAFGGTWNVQHRTASAGIGSHTGASYATAGFVRTGPGSGANGPANADYAAFFSSAKDNYLTSAVDGEFDVAYHIGRQGQKADLGGLLTDLEKVGGDTGGMTVHEASARWVDNAGTVVMRQQTVKNYAGQGSGFYGVTGVSGIGFFAEAQVGQQYAAFLADEVGGGAAYQNVIVATSGRSVANIKYKVDNAARTYGGNGSAPSPAFSFMSDPDTGMYRLGADQLGFSAGGAVRAYMSSAGVIPGADNAYALGAASTGRWANIYTVNAPTVGSDERLKTDIVDSPLGLDFILAQRPVAYRLKEGGREIEWVDEEIEVEEQETVEAEVTRQDKYFDGLKMVTVDRKEMAQVPVFDDPVQAKDPITGELLYQESFEAVLGENGEPAVRTVRKPVMHAVPRLRKVKKIVQRPVEISREGQRQHFGLIAQEVRASLPADVDFGGWVQEDVDNPESLQALRYEQFVPVLIKAVQELKTANDNLAAEVQALKAA